MEWTKAPTVTERMERVCWFDRVLGPLLVRGGGRRHRRVLLLYFVIAPAEKLAQSTSAESTVSKVVPPHPYSVENPSVQLSRPTFAPPSTKRTNIPGMCSAHRVCANVIVVDSQTTCVEAQCPYLIGRSSICGPSNHNTWLTCVNFTLF
jgi:hypothetical protein